MRMPVMNCYAPALILLAAGALSGQTSVFDQPPAGVEDALRARVAKFYQAFVDGKFRKADEVVAEDCKEEFFAAKKNRFGGFKIEQVVFEENFTKARVVALVDVEMTMVSERVKMKAPQTTLWKLEDGEWWWYIYKGVTEVDTPFGKVRRPNADEVRENAPPPMEPVSMRALGGMVAMDKTSVTLSASKPSMEKVTLTNQAPGPITLGLRPPSTPGLTAKLDRTDVSAKGSAVLQISYHPGSEPVRGPVEVVVLTFPSNTALPIQVKFADAPARK